MGGYTWTATDRIGCRGVLINLHPFPSNLPSPLVPYSKHDISISISTIELELTSSSLQLEHLLALRWKGQGVLFRTRDLVFMGRERRKWTSEEDSLLREEVKKGSKPR